MHRSHRSSFVVCVYNDINICETSFPCTIRWNQYYDERMLFNFEKGSHKLVLWRVLEWRKWALWFCWLSSSCEFSVDISALDPLVHGVSHDKLNSALGKGAAVTTGGLGVITAGVFLAGEMAGSGVLALPNAMIGTGEIQTRNMLVVQHVLRWLA